MSTGRSIAASIGRVVGGILGTAALAAAAIVEHREHKPGRRRRPLAVRYVAGLAQDAATVVRSVLVPEHRCGAAACTDDHDEREETP